MCSKHWFRNLCWIYALTELLLSYFFKICRPSSPDFVASGWINFRDTFNRLVWDNSEALKLVLASDNLANCVKHVHLSLEGLVIYIYHVQTMLKIKQILYFWCGCYLSRLYCLLRFLIANVRASIKTWLSFSALALGICI